MANTNYTLKLEERRYSEEVQNFKREVLEFIDNTNASPEMAYKIRCDLAKKIDMPFYHESKQRAKRTMTVEGNAKEYIRLLILNDDLSFAKELLTWLIQQQQQTFRRIHKLSSYQKARKKRYSKGVYEHPVPANYSKNYLLDCIARKDYETACEYIDYLSASVPQVFLTKEEDALVNEMYKDTMPDGWDWRTDTPFIRYIQAGIPEDVYNK